METNWISKVGENLSFINTISGQKIDIKPKKNKLEYKEIFNLLKRSGLSFNVSKNTYDNLLKTARKGHLNTVEIAITSSCNLRCKHCYQGNKDKDKPYTLNLKLLKKVILAAKKIGAYEIILTGGEIFTYKEIKNLIKFIKNNGFMLTLVTNGTLIDKRTVDFLVNNRPYRVVISLDGFETEHQFKRGTGTFKKSMSAIKMLIKRRIRVDINHTLNRDLSQTNRFLKFVKKLGVSRVTLIPIANAGNALKNPEILFDKKDFQKLRKIYLKHAETRCSAKRCPVLRHTISIDYDGEVYACNMFRDFRKFSLGNIYKGDLKNMYENSKKTLSDLFFFNFNDLVSCKQCKSFDKCKGGCRGRAANYYNDFLAPDPFACFIYKNQMKKNENPNSLMWGPKT